MNLTSSYTTFRREASQTSLPGIWFHGSSKPFESFRLGKYKKSQQLGFGIHFTQDESFAALYGSFIYSCNLFPTKILDTEEIYSIGSEEEEFVRALHKGTQRRLFVSDSQFAIHLDITSPARAERLLKQFGYDAVIYKAVYGSAAIGGMNVSNKARSVVMFDPGKIKILKVDKL